MVAVAALPAHAEAPEVRDERGSSDAEWREIEEVRCRLTAELSVNGFTVRDLLLLQKGSVVNSRQSTRARITVRANGSAIALAEFEVLDNRLGVRLAEIV